MGHRDRQHVHDIHYQKYRQLVLHAHSLISALGAMVFTQDSIDRDEVSRCLCCSVCMAALALCICLSIVSRETGRVALRLVIPSLEL